MRKTNTVLLVLLATSRRSHKQNNGFLPFWECGKLSHHLSQGLGVGIPFTDSGNLFKNS